MDILIQAAINLGAVSAIALFLAKQNETIMNKLVNGYYNKLEDLGDKLEELTLQVERLSNRFDVLIHLMGGDPYAAQRRSSGQGTS